MDEARLTVMHAAASKAFQAGMGDGEVTVNAWDLMILIDDYRALTAKVAELEATNGN